MPIFSKPTISARITGVNTATVQRMINSLVEAGILHVRSHGASRRATIYHLREISLIAQGLPVGRFDY